MPLDTEILGQGVYTPREAARLIGGTAQQVLRWTRGSGPTSPLWNAEFQFIEDSTEISFLDLIEVRVVDAMRRAGISLQAIRFAIQLAQEKFDVKRPLSSRDFKTDGQEVLMSAIEEDGDFVSLSKKRPGQKVFKDIVIQSLNDLEYENSLAARWRPTGFSSIVIDPNRHFGTPLLNEYGVSTATIYAENKTFNDASYLSKIYSVPLQAIKQAISYERSLDARQKINSDQGTI